MTLARIRRYAPDALIVALFVAAEVEVLAGTWEGAPAVLYLFPLGWTLPLLLRRRNPALAALTVFVSLALESQLAQAATESTFALIAAIMAFWTAGTITDLYRGLSVGVAGGFMILVVVAADPDPFGAGDAAFALIIATAPFLAGSAIAARDRHALELRHDRDQAVVDERARIARELHDVVGHAISVMTVQTSGARVLLDRDPGRAREALLAAEAAGRQAIAEMHRMLEMLRYDGDEPELVPQPGLADLDRLLDQVRASGLAVDLAVEGRRHEAPPGVELAAFRVIQEALTNVIKHAREARASVRLRYSADAIEIEVENEGGVVSSNGYGSGHGLVGMRERVALYRGELEAAPRAGGGFAVRARLPLGPEAGP